MLASPAHAGFRQRAREQDLPRRSHLQRPRRFRCLSRSDHPRLHELLVRRGKERHRRRD